MSIAPPRTDAGRAVRGRVGIAAFLALAAGYFLSYLFNSTSAVIAEDLRLAFGLSPARLGLIGAAHFLFFALAQIPVGVLLDRYGVARVQSALLLLSAVGSALFSLADHWTLLLAGRALVGIGVSGALLSGLKVIVQTVPAEKVAVTSGVLVALGTMGAVAATVPLAWVLDLVGWRGAFAGLGAAALALSLAVRCLVPQPAVTGPGVRLPLVRLGEVLRDRVFRRIAPLSATCLGTAWALQSLWAAPWLADVERMPQDEIVRHLLAMACGLVVGAVLLGVAAHRLRRAGVRTHDVLAGAALLFILLELSMLLRASGPSYLTWAVLGGFGSLSVLSFTAISEQFRHRGTGSANAVLNLAHMLAAFAMQWGMGAVVGDWLPDASGRYPEAAYLAALAAAVLLQVVALFWFMLAPSERGAVRQTLRQVT